MSPSGSALADVVAIPVTPFDGNRVDQATFVRLLERLLDAGVHVVTPNGNTSEFYALTARERRELLELSGRTVADRATLVAGIGLDVQTAVEEGRLARSAGATMAMVHQPLHPYISSQGWIDYHAAIAGELGELGIVLYVKTPHVTGEMIRELGERCPNVVGVKYAVADPVAFARTREAAGPTGSPGSPASPSLTPSAMPCTAPPASPRDW
ncbi:dihydrodipicolinate synthase family protein [Micromonospora olivasterospora]|uniref:4-hydroxy-tetrahydrodipicolinate synthase n=1 Tax=Micromonospora olivasterospora TaxID=1880 RepID=A0A562II16_MICOL|nr:dihydrodipicolinate synthase family protein [Micromonospora olivasterospora]TWH70532.1 4-hydroxy-tetrahydrodipicolinate synthase [Micromonospora olivasterospora]